MSKGNGSRDDFIINPHSKSHQIKSRIADFLEKTAPHQLRPLKPVPEKKIKQTPQEFLEEKAVEEKAAAETGAIVTFQAFAHALGMSDISPERIDQQTTFERKKNKYKLKAYLAKERKKK